MAESRIASKIGKQREECSKFDNVLIEFEHIKSIEKCEKLENINKSIENLTTQNNKHEIAEKTLLSAIFPNYFTSKYSIQHFYAFL